MSEPLPLYRKLILALYIGAGFAFTWAILALWCISIADELQSKPATHEHLNVQKNGTPIIYKYESNQWSFSSSPTYYDLDRNIIEYQDKIITWLNSARLTGPDKKLPFADYQDWTQRFTYFRSNQHAPIVWYFIHNGLFDGAGYLVGFEPESKTRVGYIGQNGFQTSPIPPEQRFPVQHKHIRYSRYSPWSCEYGDTTYMTPFNFHRRFLSPDFPVGEIYIPARNTVMKVNLNTHQVETFLELPSPILGMNISQTSETQQDYRLAVRTADSIHFISADKSEHRTIPIPKEFGNRTINWYPLPGNHALVVVESEYHRSTGTKDITLYWLSPQSEIERTRTVTLQSGRALPSEQSTHAKICAAGPVPFAMTIGATVVEPLIILAQGRADDYTSALAMAWNHFQNSLVVLLLLSLILAILCYKHQTSFAASPRHRIIWTIFVFLFGLPAFAGYRLHRRWPIRTPCPACNTKAPRNNNHCHACNTPFPNPQPTGTEIFA